MRVLVVLIFATCEANMQLRSAVASEIRNMKATTDRIVAETTNGPTSGSMFDDLGNFTDWVGPRISGSPELERAIDDQLVVWEAERAAGIGADIVYLEEVAAVPNWERGNTSEAFMTSPLIGGNPRRLNILAGGQSIGTFGPNGAGALGDIIEADVVVVETEDELDTQCASNFCLGKIIVWYAHCGPRWRGYNSGLRVRGAMLAQPKGAIASLSCSNTAYGVDTPHTGTTEYVPGIGTIGEVGYIPGVPSAQLTVEDTELLWRITTRGQTPRVSLAMSCKNNPETPSRNIIAEYKGSEYPDEYVIVGGHFDSWDVGTGAMDDMGGVHIGRCSIHNLQQGSSNAPHMMTPFHSIPSWLTLCPPPHPSHVSRLPCHQSLPSTRYPPEAHHPCRRLDRGRSLTQLPRENRKSHTG
jgi:carboxypeptidase Q